MDADSIDERLIRSYLYEGIYNQDILVPMFLRLFIESVYRLRCSHGRIPLQGMRCFGKA